MSKTQRLIQSYRSFIELPWRDDTAAVQRVMFCVYPEQEELRLRAKIGEFELATREAGHGWAEFDLTDTFPQWMASQRHKEKYFRSPHLLSMLLPRYRSYIVGRFEELLSEDLADENAVIALKGVGSLFGFLKVKEVVDILAPKVAGRLLVFFPGGYEENNYRLLDGYDGWNYHATPITPDQGR
ncbi:BREX protein BrxB domain-containing protein [Halorhodospira halophila]|uniref:BREX protein BrxB domain-containing protein n=1 Tax=Halorhodospira halophila TaxID=1053 RepID=UPI00191444F5|nr:BREX protein BrxB domain-containing protein [Halorhodospira halophila]MBK5942673.1 hypothetical protein [Halorhodospira halophila]